MYIYVHVNICTYMCIYIYIYKHMYICTYVPQFCRACCFHPLLRVTLCIPCCIFLCINTYSSVEIHIVYTITYTSPDMNSCWSLQSMLHFLYAHKHTLRICTYICISYVYIHYACVSLFAFRAAFVMFTHRFNSWYSHYKYVQIN